MLWLLALIVCLILPHLFADTGPPPEPPRPRGPLPFAWLFRRKKGGRS
jgi:hypothetical protein